MMTKDFKQAVADGKMFLMRKYKYADVWSAPKLVSAEIAEKKSHVWVPSEDEFGEVDYHCPYSFELA